MTLCCIKALKKYYIDEHGGQFVKSTATTSIFTLTKKKKKLSMHGEVWKAQVQPHADLTLITEQVQHDCMLGMESR